MDDWLARLKDERAELRERYNNLALFLGADKFDTLDKTDQTLLRIQYATMETYAILVDARIRRAEAKAD